MCRVTGTSSGHETTTRDLGQDVSQIGGCGLRNEGTAADGFRKDQVTGLRRSPPPPNTRPRPPIWSKMRPESGVVDAWSATGLHAGSGKPRSRCCFVPPPSRHETTTPQSGARDVQNRGLWPPGRFLAQFSDSAALYHRILMYGNKYERFVRHDIAKKEASHRVFADDPLVATRWAQRDSISLRETTAPR